MKLTKEDKTLLVDILVKKEKRKLKNKAKRRRRYIRLLQKGKF